MPLPINGVSAANNDRQATGIEVAAEARQRQAERLRSSTPTEETRPAEAVEAADKAEAPVIQHREQPQPYRVQLDPDTHRLYTEVIDTASGDVIMRIPPTYVPDDAEAAEEDVAGGGSDDAGKEITA